VPRIAPSRGTHLLLDRRPADGQRGLHRPGRRGRTIFALPWYGRTLVGTTDNDFDGDIDHPRPARPTSSTCSKRSNSFFGVSLTESELGRRLRRRAAADLHRDPKKSSTSSRKAELYETCVGMLTITGGKLTTLADGCRKADGRSLVERDVGTLPDHTAEIPLGHGRPAADLSGGPRGWGEALAQLAFRYGHAHAAVLDLARENSKLAAPIAPGPSRPAGRGSRSRPGWSRRAASPTCCCAAPGSGLLPRRSCADADSVRPVAEVLGAELGWSRRRSSARPRPGRRVAEAASAGGSRPRRGAGSGSRTSVE
jgi:glycerol-3-phosphate dehydrogenase